MVLNYRGADDTIACVSSLKRLDYPGFEIIVVDNASGDNSVEKIHKHHPDVRLIESAVNGGFAAGNNLGIREALENPEIQYVLVLNNDTTVEPGVLSAMVQVAWAYPGSMVGPVLRYPDGRFQRVGNRVGRLLGSLKNYRLEELQDGQVVESLSGCCMLIPRQVFETLGGWDESYFLYFEDNDFCWRAARHGFLCRVALHATVYHQEGAATGKQASAVTYYYQRNRLRLLKKFSSPAGFLLVQMYTLYRLIRSTIKTVLSPSPEAVARHRMFWLAVCDFYRGRDGKCPHKE